jgi:hypothetical protein
MRKEPAQQLTDGELGKILGSDKPVTSYQNFSYAAYLLQNHRRIVRAISCQP